MVTNVFVLTRIDVSNLYCDTDLFDAVGVTMCEWALNWVVLTMRNPVQVNCE